MCNANTTVARLAHLVILRLYLACVDALVPVGGAPLVERLGALVAFERLLARVNPLMIHQVAPPAERLPSGTRARQMHHPNKKTVECLINAERCHPKICNILYRY